MYIDNGGPVVATTRFDVDIAHREVGEIHVVGANAPRERDGPRGVAVRYVSHGHFLDNFGQGVLGSELLGRSRHIAHGRRDMGRRGGRGVRGGAPAVGVPAGGVGAAGGQRGTGGGEGEKGQETAGVFTGGRPLDFFPLR